MEKNKIKCLDNLIYQNASQSWTVNVLIIKSDVLFFISNMPCLTYCYNRKLLISFNFFSSYKLWDQATQCLAVLDVLLCMAEYSRCGDGSICRPEFLMPKAGEKVSITLHTIPVPNYNFAVFVINV